MDTFDYKKYLAEGRLFEKEGVPHYTKDGEEWKGKTHKMPDGSLMSGNPHDKDGSGPNGESEKLFHKEDLNEVELFESEEDQFGAELDAFADDLADEIKDELEDHKEEIQKSDKELNEIVGVVGIIGYILLSNTVANMLSKFAKKQFAKRDFGKGEAAAKKIYDFTHKNEEAFKAPIKRIVSLFTKDAKKQKMISDILFAIVVLAMAGQAGGNAVSYIKKAGYLKGGLYGLKAAIKGTEVSNIIKGVVQDAVS